MNELIKQNIFHDYRYGNITKKDIALNYNITLYNLNKLLKENNVIPAYKDKEWLYQQRVIKSLNTVEIAELINVSPRTIYDRLNKFGIEQKPDSIKNKKVTYDTTFFKVIDTEEKAYWLGFSMFDGCISYSTGQYRLRFQLQRNDENHLINFANLIAKNSSISRGISKRNDSITEYSVLKVYNKEICTDLISLGMVPGKKKDSTFPNIDSKFYKDFIRGAIDADGSIYIDENVKTHQLNIHLTSSAYDIVYKIKEILEDLLDDTISYRYSRNMLMLSIGGNIKAGKVIEWLYKDSNVYLPRKKDIFDSWYSYYYKI